MKKIRVQKNEQLFAWTTTYIVMGHFFKYPRIDFSLSEVAKETNLSKATLSGVLSSLRSAGFVTTVDLGVIYRIRANTDAWIYKREKIVFNYANIVRSNIVEYLANKYNNPKCIVLFGSYRLGEDDIDSDIDIAVEVPDGEPTGEFTFPEFSDFEKLVKRKVIVRVFSRKEVDKNVFTGIANGIVLFGLLEVSK